MENKQIVKMEHINKVFGNVKALIDAGFHLNRGEIHAILGENGAGKSSLMNVLCGIYTPEYGQIELGGTPVVLSSPADALKHGIGMVPQHFKLVEVMTAAENIIAGTKGKFWLSEKQILKEIKEKSEAFGFQIDHQKKLYDMSVAEKLSREIFKVLQRGAEILILDEPTAVLTPQEIDNLFQVIENMRERGHSIVIITHKLEEVMRVSDRITVMRKGETVNTVNKNETNMKELATMMVGTQNFDLSVPYLSVPRGKRTLEIKKLSAYDNNGIKVLKNLTFDLYQGEILGVAGVAGSGQKELCESITGLHTKREGDILFNGESIIQDSPEEIIKKGISLSFVPEDRLGMGLVPTMNIVDNVLLKDYKKQEGLLSRYQSKLTADELVETLHIVTPSTDRIPVSLLSGGNIQKVLLGREISLNPKVMVTAYATRGLDVGSSQLIYNLLNAQKEKKVAILYVGEDLDVLMQLSDRLMVLCEGEITGIVDPRTTTKEEIGLLMSGVSGKDGGLNIEI